MASPPFLYIGSIPPPGAFVKWVSGYPPQGGHVLGVDILNAHLTFRGMDSFTVKLPQTQRFSAFDLTVDQSADIEKIEKNT